MQYKLGNIAIFIRNGVNIKNDKSKGGIPITRIETISDGIVNENKMGYADIIDDRYKEYYLKQNDILMSHINSAKHLGKVAIFNGHKKIIHGMNLLDIRLNNDICNSKYVYYFFKTKRFKQQLNRISKQSVNQSSFTVNDLKKVKISLPLLEKQKMIANKLDKVQAIIDLRKKQIEELDELIKSQFVEMFKTKNYDKNRIGDFGKLQGGYAFKSKDFIENGIKLVQISNVNKDSLDWNEINRLPEEYIEKYKDYSLNVGDIVIAMTRPIIKSLNEVKIAYVSEKDVPCLLNQLVGRFLIDESRISKFYLTYCCKLDDFKNYVEKMSGNSLQPNISSKQVEDYTIEVPPIELQNQFADIVKQINKQKFMIEKSLKEIEELQESLMNIYFGG